MTRRSTTAFLLPAAATSPLRPPAWNVRYWRPVTSAPRGRKIRSIATDRLTEEKYIRLDEATMQPQGRRRSIRSGAEGRHVVLETGQIRRALMTKHTIRTGAGIPGRGG